MGILIKRKNLDTDTHTRRIRCEDKAEMTMILLQAKEFQRLQVNHEKLGESHETFSLTALERTNTADTLILDL